MLTKLTSAFNKLKPQSSAPAAAAAAAESEAEAKTEETEGKKEVC